MIQSIEIPLRQPKATAIRIVLIDDHAMFRAGLRGLLQSETDLEVVDEAADGESGIRLCDLLKPDVVVLDLSMPGLGGIEATQRILLANASSRVLILSAHEDAASAQAVLGAGACGYVLKRSAYDELARAIRTVMAGDTYVDPVLASALAPRASRSRSGALALPRLSQRELEVARLMAQGHTAKQMANQLKLSPRTLETYKARAMSKLALTSRADLIRYAARCGWLRDS